MFHSIMSTINPRYHHHHPYNSADIRIAIQIFFLISIFVFVVVVVSRPKKSQYGGDGQLVLTSLYKTDLYRKTYTNRYTNTIDRCLAGWLEG